MDAVKLLDIGDTPDVLRLAQEVAQSGMTVVLRRGEEELAVLMPASKARKRARRPHAGGEVPDSLLNIVGIGESAEPTDIARYKHEYLAEAYESPD